jgi:hypothetical protein
MLNATHLFRDGGPLTPCVPLGVIIRAICGSTGLRGGTCTALLEDTPEEAVEALSGVSPAAAALLDECLEASNSAAAAAMATSAAPPELLARRMELRSRAVIVTKRKVRKYCDLLSCENEISSCIRSDKCICIDKLYSSTHY